MGAGSKKGPARTRSRRRKPLPDLRPRGHTFPEPPDERGRRIEPPSEDNIHGLAVKHGFPPEFDLVGHLNWRWEWWRGSLQHGPEPIGADRKRLLREIGQRANALADAIERTGGPERKLLLEAFLAYELDLGDIERKCRQLARSASIAQRQVEPSKRGQKGDPAFDDLLYGLWRTYQKAFGADAPRLSRSDRYDGPFFKFSNDVLRLFGIEKSNNGLGKAIEKILRAADRVDAAAASSPN